jgi:uncharacterized protein (TIGR03083 family)
MSERQRYLTAARTYVEQVAAIPDGAWEGPGLGDWDLRALVGHASRSLVTVLTYLDQPAEEATVDSAVDYYLVIGRGSFDAGDVTARGVAAGEAMGENPTTFVTRLVEEVEAKLERFADDDVLTTIAGPMRLSSYLPTRTFELVVHGLDIARATGRPVEHPQEVVAEAVALAAAVAVRSGRGEELLLALTGRAPLPAGFSIV